MSSGSNFVTAYAVQTDKDVMPTTGWKILPNVSNGITNSVELTGSETIKQGRIKAAGAVTGGTVGGDLSHELIFGTFDALMEAAFWGTWTEATETKPSTLAIGVKRTMFAITKDATDININHVFTGCHVNSMQVEINTDGMVNITFNIMGLGCQHSMTKSFAINPTELEEGNPASGLSIGDILVNGTKVDVCVEAISFTIDNQSQIQKCLGNNMYGGNIHAMIANCSGNMTIAYSRKSHEIVVNQLTGTPISIEFPIEFDGGKSYKFKIPQAQIKSEIPSPSGTDLAKAEVKYTAVKTSPIIERYTA